MSKPPVSSVGVAEAPRILYYPDPESDCMVLGVDHCFEVGGLTIHVPRGYRWNGASIPRPLWTLIGSRFEPDRLLASCRHDWGYATHCAERKLLDRLFRDDLLAAGMPAWKAAAMYRAVRLFGGGSWPTSASDRAELNRVRALLADREDRDKFLRLILTV